LLREVPVRFYVFDVLSLDGRDITRQAYGTRRDHLMGVDQRVLDGDVGC
jgi:ATP-dependent DNA ligase